LDESIKKKLIDEIPPKLLSIPEWKKTFADSIKLNISTEKDLFIKEKNWIQDGPKIKKLKKIFRETIIETLGENHANIEESKKLFYDFLLKQTLSWNISVSAKNISDLDFLRYITKYQQYFLWKTFANKNWKSTTGLYAGNNYQNWDSYSLEDTNSPIKNERLKKIIKPIFWDSTDLNDHKNDIRKIKVAYGLAKRLFQEEERFEKIGNTERHKWAFSHIYGVMQKVLANFENNVSLDDKINRVVISLLHDMLEDVDWFTAEFISKFFWQDIADSVSSISKKDWKTYLSQDEKKDLKDPEKYKKMKYIWKQHRDAEYYSHIEELVTENPNDINALYVKLCDRLDNLLSMDEIWVSHIIKKVTETKKYFLVNSIKEKFPNLTQKLEIQVNILTNKISAKLALAIENQKKIILKLWLEKFKKEFCNDRVKEFAPKLYNKITEIVEK